MGKLLSYFSLWLILILIPMQIRAQNWEDIKLFQQRNFGKYYISDMFSPNTSSSFQAGLLRSGYNLNMDRNSNFALYAESYIGTEIPLISWDISGLNPSRLSVSIPLSVNLLLDLSEPLTHPVINTEYRVGALEINYLYELSYGFIKNASLKFIPFYHESSHLGDEITIYRKDAGFPITRVNATNNTAELALTINDENGGKETNHSFKIGTRILYNKTEGFYEMRPEEGDTSKISPSQNRFEWYGQYQWHSHEGLINHPKISTVFSIEIRNRVRYNYPYYIYDPASSTGPREVIPDQKYVPSVNGYLGWRYSIMEERASYLGLYFRFYVGANPHGQFRNIPVHRIYGLSLVYEN